MNHTGVRITGVIGEPYRQDDGSWIFEIPGRQLSPEEHKVLDELFPDLESGVGRLLQMQALFNCVR